MSVTENAPHTPPVAALAISSNRDDAFWASHEPIMSVVVACYAVRRYLPSFTAALDRQTIDPERYEIIFVSDGCPEDSGEVVREWMADCAFPVRLVEKENGGVATARNAGISIARGTWITSPDPDDVLDDRYFAELEAAFAAFPEATMFATQLQTITAEGERLPHPLDHRFDGGTAALIDLHTTPGSIHVSGGTAVWNRALIAEHGLHMDERLRAGSDADFNMHYLIANGARYVVVPKAIYRYLKRGDGTSIIDRASKSYTRYEATIAHSHRGILDFAGGPCPQWLANSLLYTVFHLFRGNRRANSPAYSLPSAQRRLIAAALRENLRRIGAANIDGCTVVDLPFEIRAAWRAAVEPLRSSAVVLQQTDRVRGRRKVAFFSSSPDARFTVRAGSQANAPWQHTVRAVEFLGETWCYEHLVWVDTDPSEKITLTSKTRGFEFLAKGLARTEEALLGQLGIAATKAKPLPATPAASAGDASRAGGTPTRSFSAGAWVIDLPQGGSRSAVALHRRLAATHPEIDLWLVADDAALPAELSHARDRVVARGSTDHGELMASAAILFSSDLKWFSHNRVNGRAPKKTWRFVFLPDEISWAVDHRAINGARVDTVLAASRLELSRYIGAESSYGLPARDVWAIGHPYHDDIQGAVDGMVAAHGLGTTLLIAIDTRRDWPFPGDPGYSVAQLAEAPAVQQWRELIHDRHVLELCQRYSLRAQLAVPPGFADLAEALELPEWITLAEPGSGLEAAIADARVCLTDYSAYSFDVALRGTPVVYVQADREVSERDSLLSLPGAFDFAADGFGPLVASGSAAIERLAGMLDESDPDHASYRDRAQRFHLHHDRGALDRLIAELLPAEAATADQPALSLLIHSCTMVEGLLATLDSIESLDGPPIAEIVVLAPHAGPEIAEAAAAFAERHPNGPSILVPESLEALVSVRPTDRLTGAWLGLVAAGVRLRPDTAAQLAGIQRTRTDVQLVAAPPRTGRSGSLAGDTAESVSLAGLSYVSAETSPHAFVAAEYCAFIRRTALPGGTVPANLSLADYWQLVIRGIEAGDMAFAVSGELAHYQGEAPVTVTFVGRTRGDRERYIDALLARAEAILGTTAAPGPWATSLALYLLSKALRTFLPESANPEWVAQMRQRAAALVDRLTVEQILGSPWATKRNAAFALTSAGGHLAQPWVLGEPGDPMLTYRGEPAFAIGDLTVRVIRVDVLDQAVAVEAYFARYGLTELDLALRAGDGRVIRAVESHETGVTIGSKHGAFTTSVGSLRRFIIPIDATDTTWALCYVDERDGSTTPARKVSQEQGPFVQRRGYVKRLGVGGSVELQRPGSFVVSPNRPLQARYNFAVYRRLRAEGITAPERLRVRAKKQVILITDRPSFGDDNGEALFRYIQSDRPDLRAHTWLVLARSAPGFAELSRTRRVVEPGTRKHRELFLNARIFLTSHVAGAYNDPYFDLGPAAQSDVPDATTIWLQHGVALNRLDPAFSRPGRGFDGVVVSAHHEVAYACSPELALTERRVLPTGLSRFDLLEDRSDPAAPVLLYMPTWRNWLTGRRRPDGTSEPVDGFEREEYFTRQRAFLTDPNVHELLRSVNGRIEMVLHPAMSAYADRYLPLASERVVIHEPGTVRYSDIFARGTAMITDFSSAFSDFAYLGKPVIFDQYDEERFRGEHYGEGVFSYADQAPGPIVRTPEQLLTELRELIARGFTIAPEYAERVDRLFLQRDRKNRERTIEAALQVDAARRRGE